MNSLPIRISEDNREPIYYQIERQLAAMIVSGQLPEGTSLPSIRALANDLSCSIITTRRVYQNLEQQGLIKVVQGKGTFVAKLENDNKTKSADNMLRRSFREVIDSSLQLGHDAQETREIFESELERAMKERGKQP